MNIKNTSKKAAITFHLGDGHYQIFPGQVITVPDCSRLATDKAFSNHRELVVTEEEVTADPLAKVRAARVKPNDQKPAASPAAKPAASPAAKSAAIEGKAPAKAAQPPIEPEGEKSDK